MPRPPALVPAIVLLACLVLTSVNGPTLASPADQYVMFVSHSNYFVSNSNRYPPFSFSIGSIEAADWSVNADARDAGLIPLWDGSTILFKAVLSTQAEPAVIRFNYLNPDKPILNTMGQQIVASRHDLFAGESTTLLAPILHPFGNAPPPNTAVWTGTLPTGFHSNSCGNWSNSNLSGRYGLADATDGRWCNNGLQGCNFGGRFYALGVLESPRYPGDYNDDNTVDAADYVVWRKTLGQTGKLLPADGNGNGTVDAADFDEWRRNFGEPTPRVINVSTEGAPNAIGAGSTLNLYDGGTIGPSFEAGSPAQTSSNVQVNIHGGSVGDHFDVNKGATMTITGGSMGNYLDAKGGSIVNIAGGAVGREFSALRESVVNISAGTIGQKFTARSSTVNISGGIVNDLSSYSTAVVNVTNGSVTDIRTYNSSVVNIAGGSVLNAYTGEGPEYGGTVNISGGSVGAAVAFDGGMVNISGGSVGVVRTYFGDVNIMGGMVGVVQVYLGTINISGGSIADAVSECCGTLNLFGTQFFLNGAPIAGLVLNENFEVTDRNVILSGVLADMSPFSFDLRKFSIDPLEDITVTLVAPGFTMGAGLEVTVPEPASVTLLLLALPGWRGWKRQSLAT